MPKIVVQIEWDQPNDPHWLNADNVALALHAYCKNTHFVVQEAAEQIAGADRRTVVIESGQSAEVPQ